MRQPTNDDAADLADARHRDRAKNNGRPTDFTLPRYVVLAVKANGTRLVAGRFDSLEIAEKNARLLIRLARLTGGSVTIEHAGTER